MKSIRAPFIVVAALLTTWSSAQTIATSAKQDKLIMFGKQLIEKLIAVGQTPPTNNFLIDGHVCNGYKAAMDAGLVDPIDSNQLLIDSPMLRDLLKFTEGVVDTQKYKAAWGGGCIFKYDARANEADNGGAVTITIEPKQTDIKAPTVGYVWTIAVADRSGKLVAVHAIGYGVQSVISLTSPLGLVFVSKYR